MKINKDKNQEGYECFPKYFHIELISIMYIIDYVRYF